MLCIANLGMLYASLMHIIYSVLLLLWSLVQLLIVRLLTGAGRKHMAANPASSAAASMLALQEARGHCLTGSTAP